MDKRTVELPTGDEIEIDDEDVFICVHVSEHEEGKITPQNVVEAADYVPVDMIIMAMVELQAIAFGYLHSYRAWRNENADGDEVVV